MLHNGATSKVAGSRAAAQTTISICQEQFEAKERKVFKVEGHLAGASEGLKVEGHLLGTSEGL